MSSYLIQIIRMVSSNYTWSTIIYLHTAICIYPTPPCVTQGQILSLTGLNSVFLFLDWFPHQGERAQSALLFTHS